MVKERLTYRCGAKKLSRDNYAASEDKAERLG